MGAKNLTPEEKAALLILAMGEEAATSILRSMPSSEVIRTLKTLRNLGRIDQDTADSVLRSFRDQIRHEKVTLRGDAEMARRLFQKVLPGEIEQDWDRLLEQEEAHLVDLLESIDDTSLARFLAQESPPQIAVTLAFLPSSRAAQCLKLLPSDTRVPILKHLAAMDRVAPQALKDLTLALEELRGKKGRTGGPPIGGHAKVAALLNAFEPSMGRALLEGLRMKDPHLASAIQSILFQFPDLARLPDRSIAEVLKRVPIETLKTAMKDAPQAVLEAIFRNMSERAQELLRDDLAAMGPIKKKDVLKAHIFIAETAQKLIEDGQIIGPNNSGDYV